MEPPKPHIPYTGVRPERKRTFGPSGAFEWVYEVHFIGPNNYHGTVTVPESKFNPGEVDRMIEAHLDQVTGVQALGEQPHPENQAAG